MYLVSYIDYLQYDLEKEKEKGRCEFVKEAHDCTWLFRPPKTQWRKNVKWDASKLQHS